MLRFPLRKEPPQLPFDDASVASPPSAFGTFRVLHQIGSGVLGPVFRALDPEGDRLVAIKAFKLDLLPEQAERFAAQLRALVSPPSPHGMVTVVDAGITGITPFAALEYATGDPLDAVLRQSGAPSPVQAVEFCKAMAGAIDAAWDRGVGHGSLHPRDVFIGSAPGDVAITGFGVAQALEAAGVKSPVRRPYAAPERVAGAAWDRRADVYALAAMVHETLRATRSGLPSAVQAVLTRGLAEDPDERFATASLLAEWFAAAVSSTPSLTLLDEGPPAMILAPAEDEGPALRPVEVELSDRVEELPLRPAAPAAALTDMAAPFPWSAIVAVALAGLAVGGAAGYGIGVSRGAVEVVAPPRSSAPESTPAPAPEVAEIPKAPEPAPAQPSTPARTEAGSRPSTPAAVATGTLTVDSRPRGARVTLDGRVFGATPLRVPELVPGDHRVLIELAGHRRIASTVRVIAGEQARLAVTLEQSAGSGGVRKNR